MRTEPVLFKKIKRFLRLIIPKSIYLLVRPFYFRVFGRLYTLDEISAVKRRQLEESFFEKHYKRHGSEKENSKSNIKYIVNPHSIDQVISYYDSKKDLICRNKSDLLFDFDSVYSNIKEYLPEIHFNKNVVGENKILFPNDASVWTYDMLNDYFNFMDNFISRLNKLALTLKDGHPWNVMFDFYKPYFLDIGSIIPKLKTRKNKEFTYYKKLLPIYYISSGIYTREGLSDRKGDIRLSRMFKDVFFRDSFVNYSWKIKRFVKFISGKENIERKSKWSSYIKNVEIFNAGLKGKIVESVLNKVSGKYMLDIGCNTGYHSILAANKGYEVLALDKDEAVVNQLYLYVKKHKLKIIPLAADLELYNMVEIKTPPALRFYNFDLVICLALLHHLVHSQKYDFFSFFDIINPYASKYLLVEFIDYNSKYLSEINQSFKKPWYNIKSFINSGLSYFSSYELFDFHDKGRRFILFKK